MFKKHYGFENDVCYCWVFAVELLGSFGNGEAILYIRMPAQNVEKPNPTIRLIREGGG